MLAFMYRHIPYLPKLTKKWLVEASMLMNSTCTTSTPNTSKKCKKRQCLGADQTETIYKIDTSNENLYSILF